MFVVYLFETPLFQACQYIDLLFWGRKNKNLPLHPFHVWCCMCYISTEMRCSRSNVFVCVCVWLVNADAPPHPHPFVTLLLISSRRKPYFGLSVSSVQPRRHRSRSPRFPCWSNRQIIRRSNTGSSLLLYVYTIRPPFFCPPSFISFSLSEVILTKRWLWLISPRWFLLIFFRWMF